VLGWVSGAKQEATRLRRLDTLIACCARGEAVPGWRGGVTPAAARAGAKPGRRG
jgi:hypothetical protein